jgi:solute carrier family 13 (sodium-dependent dicarboxylate transporter), member 2/3/5
MAVDVQQAPPVAAAASADHDHSTLKLAGVGAAVLVAAAIWMMPTPEGLSLLGHKALALFGCIFVLYLTEAIPLAIASLLVVPAAALSGITTVKGALEGFSASSAYLIVGAFVLATAMVKTRLAERITYIILLRIGSAPTRITLGVTLVNIVLAFLVPSSTARTAILLPECLSILALYSASGRSPFAVNLLLTLTMTNATIGAGILTATVPNPVTVEFIAKGGGHTISYAEWLLYGFPPALLMTFATWALIQRVFPPEAAVRQGGSTARSARTSPSSAACRRQSGAPSWCSPSSRCSGRRKG